MLIIDNVTIKSGKAFKKVADRKNYVVTSVHKDGSISFTIDHPNTQHNYLNRVRKEDIIREGNEDFVASFKKFIESTKEARVRVNQERAETAARFDAMQEDFEEALKFDVLMDAKMGNMESAMEKLEMLLEESRLKGHWNAPFA